jgi:hypothetical protein
MGHPTLENTTPFPLEPLFVTDEEGRQLLVPLIKATYKIAGSLALADDQLPYSATGERWGGKETASYKYEPETAFTKLATDVVLIGHTHAPSGTTQVDVGLRIGQIQKIARVFGDRYWVKTGGSVIATRPLPADQIPLTYERAFGGWDKAHIDPVHWRSDARNPVGVGFGDPLRFVEEGRVPLPNIEDPNHLIKRYGDSPPPAGFGFVSADWEPRARYAGTYDKAWDQERKPLLPKDFDRRFFNAASPGLIAPGYLKGNEDVAVVNASAVSPLRFRLPDVSPPTCDVELRGGKKELLQTSLDTVIINTDEMLVILLWRAYVRLPNGPHDVTRIKVAAQRDVAQRATG